MHTVEFDKVGDYGRVVVNFNGGWFGGVKISWGPIVGTFHTREAEIPSSLFRRVGYRDAARRMAKDVARFLGLPENPSFKPSIPGRLSVRSVSYRDSDERGRVRALVRGDDLLVFYRLEGCPESRSRVPVRMFLELARRIGEEMVDDDTISFIEGRPRSHHLKWK